MTVVFQQADLDTCVAAVVLGVPPGCRAVHRPFGALAGELADPSCLCLEAGGSGQTARNNFDHHNTRLPLPPACVQAHAAAGSPPDCTALVEFAALVDLGGEARVPPFPNLSNLVSGVRLLYAAEPERQFREGVAVIQRVRELGLDPFRPLPALAEWDGYLRVRQQAVIKASGAIPRPRWWTCGACDAASVETNSLGAAGHLYRMGAAVAVVTRRLPGPVTRWKTVIGSSQFRVDGFLPALNTIEPGWGGPAHGTIVGSPRKGSRLRIWELEHLLGNAARRILGESTLPESSNEK